MNIHHISVLNPNFASQNVQGFLRLGELGTVKLCMLSFTFHIHSYGTTPQKEEAFGLNTGAESSLITRQLYAHLTGTELSGSATVVASVLLFSLASYGFILPSA